VLDEFYKQSEAMTIWSEIKDGKDDQRQNDKYSLFWNHIKKEKLESVLDVGCGNGYFLHNCPPGIDLMGVEPNADSARHCSVPIINPSEIRGKFDLVTFFGVMEHLKDPIAVLNHYVQFVENDGYIGIIVPNINSLAFDILGDENCTICPQHLWYFSINTLSTLMEKVGFKLHSFNTQETEYQPIVRKLHGISPYNKCGGLELDHPAIKEKDILKHNLGTKICAIYKKGV
jgi:SAM-dependent methyltransferase